MNNVKNCCIFFLCSALFCNSAAIEHDEKNILFAGGGAVIGALVTLAVKITLIPWITGRKVQKEQQRAYDIADKIYRKHENMPACTQMSLDELKESIDGIKKDTRKLEKLINGDAFTSDSTGKKVEPLKTIKARLEAQLGGLKAHFTSEFIHTIYTRYEKELHLYQSGKINHGLLKECIDEQCGDKPFRHYCYVEALEEDIAKCMSNCTKEYLGFFSNSAAKLNELDAFLKFSRRILVSELQQEFELKQSDERCKAVHDAELSRTREETNAYSKLKQACDEFQSINAKQSTVLSHVQQEVQGVKKAVKLVKEEINQGRFWDKLIRDLDQSGSEQRIIKGIKKVILSGLNSLRHDLTVIKERLKGNKQDRQQDFTQLNDNYATPPPTNPEYIYSPSPSAPPL